VTLRELLETLAEDVRERASERLHYGRAAGRCRPECEKCRLLRLLDETERHLNQLDRTAA
jgi:hypothetical protein